MSLKNVDFDHVFRRLADKRIEDAMAEGKFDHLPGAGQPLDLEPMPADENARMTWWALRILRNNDYIPEEVRWRKTVDRLRGEIWRLTDEARLPKLVAQVNAIVHKINTLGTNAMKMGMSPLDLETERQRLQERLSDGGGGAVAAD